MTGEKDLNALELAALLSSKVCHDVISPVGAIVNGLEVLEEETDEEGREFAMTLIRSSADQASAKLKFARLAYGASGSAGSSIDIKDAEIAAQDYIDPKKIELSWSAPAILLPKDVVKLLLNLVLISISTIPRGGKISVLVTGDAEAPNLEVVSTGERHRIAENIAEYFGGSQEKPADAHAAQPYYTLKLAEACALTVTISDIETGVFITAIPD